MGKEKMKVTSEAYYNIVYKLQVLRAKISDPDTHKLAPEEVYMLRQEYQALRAQLNDMELIDEMPELVALGDTLKLDVTYFDGDNETIKVKLVSKPQADDGELSVLSAMGKAIFCRVVGSEVSYDVNGYTNKVVIVDKLTSIENDDTLDASRVRK